MGMAQGRTKSWSANFLGRDWRVKADLDDVPRFRLQCFAVKIGA